MRQVVLHLPDTIYDRLAKEATASDKPLEQWIIDLLTADMTSVSRATESHEMLAAALDALGFQRLDPVKARRLSVLLTHRQERPLSDDETAELQTLMVEADALELVSLQRLAAALRR
jgi:hypothetical protein